MAFKMRGWSAFTTNGPRGWFRQFRDDVKADWHNVPRGSYYKGVKQDVVGETKTQEELDENKESMIEMAKRLKAEKEGNV
jgi:hypothetical protein